MNSVRKGIVKIGTIPQVVHVVIDQFEDNIQAQGHLKPGGQIKSELHEALPSFNNKIIAKSREGTMVCSLSQSSWITELKQMLHAYDILYVFFNEEEIELPVELLEYEGSCRILMIPINIFSEQNPLMNHIGFDTALNEVVNNVYKVSDTAGSLILSGKRLFLIKLPGNRAGNLLLEAARALQCDYLMDESSREFERVKRLLEQKYAKGTTYAILLFNGTVNEKTIIRQISGILNVELRSVMIEEAQCIGRNVTVSDKLQAIRLAEKMVEWTLSERRFDLIRFEKSNDIKMDTAI